jgi:AcrR family transcriptional regulator
MKGETLDRRIRKTRRVIRQCLTELLKTKRLQDITVREISEKADINRGTFYLHYRDIFDLMEQIENELLEELEDVLNHFKASDLLSNPALVFTRVFQLVKENSDMVSILIGQNGDINFVNRLKDIVREKCLKDWMELFRPGAGGGRQTSRSSQSTLLDDSAFEAYYSFTVTGCIGLVQYWLDSGLKETPEQLASLVEQIISKGLRMFQPEAGL